MPGNADLKSQSSSVVIVGSFNPLVFQPEWLAQHEIIGREEAVAARDGIEIIHPRAVQLQLQGLVLNVTPGRYQISATEAPLVRAKDFAVRCLELLPHMPARAVGLNFGSVFKARSRADWDALGDALAPKQPWKELLGNMQGERSGGLIGIVMERAPRNEEGYPGSTSVALEVVPPTVNMETSIEVNDHYDLVGDDVRSEAAIPLLEARWTPAEEQARRVTDSLMELCRAG